MATTHGAECGWGDGALLQACLDGREEAWSALIDKKRNLIFAIPLEFGLSEDDANEIFREVCMALLSELEQFRECRDLTHWLIKRTAHACASRMPSTRTSGTAAGLEGPDLPAHLVQHLRRAQVLREALLSLGPGCRDLVAQIVFGDAAKDIGDSDGVQPKRTKCLQQLRQRLEKSAFR